MGGFGRPPIQCGWVMVFIYGGNAHTKVKGVFEIWGKDFPENVAVEVTDADMVAKLRALGCFEEGIPTETPPPHIIDEEDDGPGDSYEDMDREQLQIELELSGVEFNPRSRASTYIKQLRAIRGDVD